ncbi:MAG: DNA methyltransferase [Allosphingosinicella sp.]|uniref:DNA methyltransferase n=1 Tax=Allosphingosinicella sp. TaxID=2823234 RepID=UPI00395CEB1F
MRRAPSPSACAAGEGASSYLDFVRSKVIALPPLGLPVAADAIHPVLKPHQAAIVRWAVEGGRRAIFAAFGLGKSLMQLEIMRQIGLQLGGRQLIVVPLTVLVEFKRDARLLGMEPVFIKSTGHLAHPLSDLPPGEGQLYLTNYESVREGKLDLSLFNAASLDEASCLRGFGGTKTFREFMKAFDGMAYKFVATATPSPNEYVELLAYCAFLEVMDVGQAKTRFFRRNSEKADELTIHPHKEREFWLWINSWAAFVQKPSDLGFSDEGYELPEIDVRWHEVPSDHRRAGEEADGQRRLLKEEAIGVVAASAEKKESLGARIAKLMELRAEDPAAHRIIWHDLEREREAIEAAVPNVVSVYGAQPLDERERAIIRFSDGEVQELAAKPVLAGSGCNFQRHCHWAIFLGIGFKFNDFIQAIHRIQRFLQTHQVRIDLIYSEAERSVRKRLEEKWKRHKETAERMSEIIRSFGLGLTGARDVLVRSIEDGEGCTEEAGDGWVAVRSDTVIETAAMAADSVGLIVTSIPFSTQYEYSPSYNDFGHSDDNAHFFRQMDWLTPELLRVLKPGRIAAIHVKDRVRPGGLEGVGFQTVDPFHADCIQHYRRHGFFYMGMITVETDVVRENNQTYRLGYSEQRKDGSRMSVGMPEYVLLFRKAPSDPASGYADERVVKEARWYDHGTGAWENPEGYSLARWQVDAHAKWRSSGDRMLTREDLIGQDARTIYRLFRGFSHCSVYDYEHHIALVEALTEARQLPTGFALLPPAAWHSDVWSDVARMRTLNGVQAARGKEMHLCPLQFDIVDRLIRRFSNEGDLVFDPFGGLMTVPLRAVMMKRRGRGHELNPDYFADGVAHLREQDRARATPSLFDLIEASAEADDAMMEAAE